MVPGKPGTIFFNAYAGRAAWSDRGCAHCRPDY